MNLFDFIDRGITSAARRLEEETALAKQRRKEQEQLEEAIKRLPESEKEKK